MAVLSTVPFRAGRQPSASRTEVVLRPADARPVDLIAVHLPSATRVGVNVWEESYAELADAVVQRGAGLVVAGDFNATSGMVPFRHVAAVGDLRDAQDVGGGGFRATWSEVVSPVPALLRLDHVLVGGRVRRGRVRLRPARRFGPPRGGRRPAHPRGAVG